MNAFRNGNMKSDNLKKDMKGKRSIGKRLLSVFLALVLIAGGVLADLPARLLTGGPTEVRADDLVNTVPNEEVTSGSFYSDTIYTGFAPNGYTTKAEYGPGYGEYTVKGVYQSLSTESPTSFAAGLPLGTIFIDQTKIKDIYPEPEIVSKKEAIIAGLGVVDGRMSYDGTKPGAIPMVPGKINKLDGDLFTITFENAAVLPNGDRADLVITYSNAQIVIDQRYLAAPEGEQYYHGAVHLARGNAFAYGGSDKTNMSTFSGDNGANLVKATAQSFGDDYSKPGSGNKNRYPATGLTMDATYQIVNKDGTPAAGTFVFAICGINLDRDPDVGGSNNSAKPLWYVGTEKIIDGTKEYQVYTEGSTGTQKYINKGTTTNPNWFELNSDGTVSPTPASPQPSGVMHPVISEEGKDHSFFSEAMEIKGGQKSQYVYVRPNINKYDNPEVTDVKGQYFYANVSLHNGNIKFIGNGVDKNIVGGNGLSGNDNSYNAGFVTLADAAKGFKVTATGHGTYDQYMNSPAFNSKQIWYRYTDSSGPHGKIQTTSEGNWGGKLNDGGDVLTPDGAYNYDAGTPKRNRATYVVAEGKTVTYTMTPDIGYKASRVLINGQPVKINGEHVSSMKKGDSVTVTTAAGKQGTLKYEEDGTYTFIFPYALADEDIHVDWEPTTADLYIAKIWKDNDDEDGLRSLIYGGAEKPKFKLQYSTNGGRNWNDVKTGETKNSDIANTQINPERTYNDQDVPSGEVSGAYRDGTYYINNGTSGSYKEATTQPVAENLVPTYETCQSMIVMEDTTTRKRYVEVGGTYKEVEKADHPFTWEHLPVYTYDDSGVADRPISYRIVEETDPVHRDYKKAQYFDSQAFELTSEKSKTWNGWQIYKENGSDNYYVLKGDGLYYLVSSSPFENADGVVNPMAPTSQPDKDKLTPISSNTYRTTDKGIPYQSEEILNEHTVRKLYVDVNKFWDDRDLLEAITTGANDYQRVELKFILHGETEGGGGVDLNGDAQGEDLELILEPTEDGAKYDKIDGYQIYKDAIGNQYAQVIDHATAENGYYPVSEGAIDYTKAADVNPLDLSPIINEKYKVDEDRFGVCFNDLPTHDNGKNIVYTVKEQFKIGDTWYDAGESEVSWVTNGGELNPERDSSHEVKGYETIFSNTPRVENKYVTLPITIAKRDAKTTNVLLEGAEFTIYRNAITGEKALDNEGVKIEGQKIYTHGSLEYVLRKEAGDTEEKYYTFAKKNDGTYEYTLANPQPKETDLKVKQGDVKSNVVYTSTQGLAMVEFQEPGTYYIKETKAPAGYTADPTIYAFIVNEDLKTIKLMEADEDHATSWWRKLYDMLFHDGEQPITYENWSSETMTLTVDDEPLSANVLVRKYWEDNDDQDGVRPKDQVNGQDNPDTPNVILQWTTTAHTAEGQPVYQSGDKKYIHNTTDDKYYEVIEEDTIGTFETAAADPEPENVTETGETCQGRKVYKDGSDQKYVFVDEKYHKVTAVDTTGSVSPTAAEPQPDEDELELVKDGDWTDVIIGVEEPGNTDKAIERVSYAGGPVKTSQTDAYTWSNVKAYRDGKVVVYRVHETSPLITDGTYSIKFSHTSDTHEKVFTLVNPNGGTHNQTVDVTNKHVTRVIQIEAYKTWNDEDQNKRQEATLTLWKEVNGARSIVTKMVEGHAEADTGTVPTTDETDPVKVWSDLPAYEMGYPITYSIVETTIDGYKTVYEVDYTKAATDTDPEKEIEEEGSAIDASVVKRTYYTQEDKDAGRIPQGKKVGDESTTAAFRIENEETIDIEVEKTWVDGANATVTFELWRTTTPETDWDKSNFKEEVICYKHNETGDRISVQDYEALPGTEKSNYTEQRGKNWSPYDPEDATVIVDGWEKVDECEFAASLFEVSSTGDAEPYTFEDLPRQELDDEGNYHKYTYRILETPKLVRLAADQTDDFKVKNYNLHASSGFANVEVVKELQGRAWNAGGLEDKFYFELDPQSATDTTDPTHTIDVSDIPLPTRTLSRELYEDAEGKYYVKDADNMYREVTENTSTTPSTYTVADKPVNPQPKDADLTNTGTTCEASVQYAVDSTKDTKDKEVGALGRAADFKSIEFSDETVIPRGHTVEFNYKVREVFDLLGTSLTAATGGTGKRDGISYADFDDEGNWTQAEHDLKIVVVNDLDGKMTTTILWDDNTETGAVPVFTNKYSSESYAKAWIEKEIASREWVEYNKETGKGDAFQFEVLAISGSQLNVPGADHSQGTDDSYTSKLLISNATGNPQEDIQKQSDTEYAFGLTGNKYTGDMLNSSGEGYFIYAISEKDAATSKDDDLGLSDYKVDGLTYDDSTIYAKVKVTDNWDGTLSFDVKYYSDAACRHEIKDYKVWIQDKFTGGSVDPTAADPQPTNLTATTEVIGGRTVYADTSDTETAGTRYVKDGEYYHEIIGGTETKRLLSQEEIAAMGSMTPEQKKANGYVEKNVAHFTNRETVDIPVVKEWVGGPAIEDVNLHLVRHLYEMTDSFDESTLTYAAIKAAEKAWDEEAQDGPFWTTEGFTHIAKRGEFLKDDGTPDYDQGSNDTTTRAYENIDKFNKDLPKYVKENGKTYRAVYKLVEDDTSNTYTTTYRSSKEGEEGEEVTKGNSIFLGGETLIVTNTVTATNTANIAAVKQFLGRNWASTDKFDFTLEAVGIGIYDKDTGALTGINDTTGKAKVPMPARYVNNNDPTDVKSISEYEELSDEEKANYTKVGTDSADAVTGDEEVDKNGHLERLASFDEIFYTVNDLQYDPVEKHYQGDFYYIMKEKLPEITDDVYPVAYTSSTQTTEKAIEDKQLPTLASGEKLKTVKFSNGITYDCDEHTVHVKVRENRTGKLQTQIAYDYDDFKDISSGTQYTPVYTNRYDAEGVATVGLDKNIRGRDWKVGDKFDFVMIPMAGAPFTDADRNEFPEQDTHKDGERNAELNAGYAVHNKEGEHVKRIIVTDETKDDPVQTLTFPKLKYTYSQLGLTAKANEIPVPTADHTPGTEFIPEGTAYAQFMYAIEESNAYGAEPTDLDMDPDTEYARITVVDKGDGTLDYYVEIFEDRYAQTQRYVPDPTTGEATDDPATRVNFTNKLNRDLTAIKAWDGVATEDVTLKLQWSVNGTNWYDVEGTSWFPNVEGTKIIKKGATGDDLKAKWTGLPAYANISEHDDKTGETGDNLDLNDLWLYYRVVEEAPSFAEVRYNETAYVVGDQMSDEGKYKTTPFHTGPEKEGEKWIEPEKRVKELHVTNFPREKYGKADVNVVKQYIGKVWEDEKFEFVIEPEKSKLGDETDYVNEGDDRLTGFYVNTETGERINAETYEALDPEEKEAYTAEKVANALPKYNGEHGNKAEVDVNSGKVVSINERSVIFDTLTIKRSDLKLNSEAGQMTGEFVYKIKEVIPPGAKEITEGGKTYHVYDDAHGNKIKLTGEEHTVTIKAIATENAKLDITISYDDNEPGSFVPVYTNYAMSPTPIEGTKTWIGGKEAEHVNGTVELDPNDPTVVTTSTDALGLKLHRKLNSDNAEDVTLTHDDAGRLLVIVWAKITPETTYVATSDDTVVPSKTYYADDEGTPLDPEPSGTESPAEEGWYEQKVVYSYEKQETGNGTYTIMAKDGANYVAPILNVVDTAGYTYNYRIEETTPRTGYAPECEGLDVTNTYAVTDNLKVTKTWDDGSDAEGFRPTKVIVHLYKLKKVEGSTESVQVEVDKKEITKQPGDTDDNTWSTGVEWNGLKVYDEAGEPIEYFIIEENEYGYTTTYSVDGGEYKADCDKIVLDGQKDKTNPESDTNNPQTVDVKNKLTPAVTEVPVTKVWDDNNNVDGRRPTSVSIRLMARVWDEEEEKYGDAAAAKKADGTSIPDLVLTADDASATDANKWTGKFENLPATLNEKTVLYSVEETAVGAGYDAPVITGDQLGGFTVTNSREREVVSAAATKIWSDLSNALNTRPDTVKFDLYKTTDATKTAADIATMDRAKDEGGNDITLVLSAEDMLGNANTWSETITGLPKNELVPVADSDPVTYESKPIFYFFKENPVPTGYIPTVVVDEEETETDAFAANGTITNSLETKSLKVIKTWDDGDNQDHMRPETEQFLAKLTLFAGDLRINPGTATGVTATCAVDATDSNKYVVVYTGLPVYDGEGKALNYTITEDAIAGYTITAGPTATTLTPDDPTITLTNKHEPGTTELQVKKVWIGDEASQRPATLTVQLERKIGGGSWTDVTGRTITLDGVADTATTGDRETEAWRGVFTNLPTVDSTTGKDILYRAKEPTVPDGYKQAPPAYENGLTILKNALNITTVTVTKQWNDDSNRDGKRLTADAFKALLTISANRDAAGDLSAKVPTVVDNGDNTYTITYTDLVHFDPADDAKIVYTVTEDITKLPEGYEGTPPSAVEDGTLVNTYTPETVDVEATKVWVDDTNADGDRPDSVTLQLYKSTGGAAEPVPGKTLTVCKPEGDTVNTWTAELTDLPKYELVNGAPVEIVYTFREDPVPEGYDATYSADGLTVTNTRLKTTACVTAKKEWNDSNNQDGKRTDVVFTLMRQVGQTGTPERAKYADGTTVETFTISADINKPQSAAWHDLPVYDENGNAYIYTVTEAADCVTNGDYTETNNGSVTLVDGDASLTVMNSRDAATTKLTATKVWDDEDNKEGLRTDVTLKLVGTVTSSAESSLAFDFGEKTIAVDATAEDREAAGTAEWTNLPVYHDGYEITYSLTELAVPGYTTDAITIGTDEETGGMIATVTNRRTPETDEVKATKVWVEEDGDTTQRSDVSLTLMRQVGTAAPAAATVDADGEPLTNPVTIEKGVTGEDLTATWSNLPQYEGGKPIVYTVEESADCVTAGYYTKEITGDAADGYTVTNTHIPQTVDINAKKTWVDNNNEEHQRPNNVTFTLWKQPEGGEWTATDRTIVLTGADTAADWTDSIAELPLYENGERLTYGFKEETIEGYTASPAADADPAAATGDELTATITNTITAAEVTFTGTKVWVDPEDRTEKHDNENEVTLTLYRKVEGGAEEIVKNGDVNLAPTWTDGDDDGVKETYTYAALPKYDADGKTYTYWVVETQVRGYEAPVYTNNDRSVTDKAQNNATITNTFTNTAVTVSAEKVWEGDDAVKETTREGGVEFTLYQTVDGAKKVADKDLDGEALTNPAQIAADAEGSALTVTWENLPKYDGTKLITYTVEETKVPDGYSTKIEYSNREAEPAWTETQPENWNSLTSKQIRVTNTWDRGKTTVTVRKVWEGDTDLDGTVSDVRPDELEVKLQYKDRDTWKDVTEFIGGQGDAAKALKPGSKWAGSWTELYKYDANGKEIEYRVIEPTVPEGYTKTEKVVVSGNRKVVILTNTYNAVAITGTKVWIDGGKTHNNTEEVVLTVKDKDDKTLTEGEDYHVDWSGNTYTIRGLKKTGEPYTVTETQVSGYADPVYANTGGQASVTDKAYDGATITNTIAQDTTSVTVTKKWVGANTEPVTVKLLADGEETGDETTLQGNDSSYTFNNLNKFALGETGTAGDGHEIIYTIVEVQGEDSSDYHTSIQRNADGSFTITNSFDETMIHVSKIWEDNNNQDGIRPDSIAVSLEMKVGEEWKAAKTLTGEKVEKLTLKAVDGWSGDFRDVPRTDNSDKTIEYRVVETETGAITGDAATGYAWSAEPIEEEGVVTGFKITNTHTSELVTVKAVKIWDDAGVSHAADLHTDVKFHLYGLNEGKVVYDGGEKTIAKDATGEEAVATWADQPKFHHSSTPLTWQVVEEAVFGFQTDVTYNEETGQFEVTNTYVGPTTQITVDKEWNDEDNVDGVRPSEITYELWKKVGTAEAEKADEQTVTVEADGSASYTWYDLPTEANEEQTVEEHTVTEPVMREATAEDVEAGLATEVGEMIPVTREATQDDIDAGIATEIGEPIPVTEERTIEERTETTSPILYSVKEQAVANYSSVVEAVEPGVFKAINTHERERISVTVTKEWEDGDDEDGKRPDHITFDLLAKDGITIIHDGKTKIEGLVIAEETGWTITIHDLPKFSDGKVGELLVYDAVETNYSKEYTPVTTPNADGSFTITNIYDPAEKLTVTVTKVWAGEDPADKTAARPDETRYHLIQVIDGLSKDMGDAYIQTYAKDATVDLQTGIQWTDLPAFVDGKSTTYRVEEEVVPGYRTEVSNGESPTTNVLSFTVTNTRVDKITITYEVPDPTDPTGEKKIIVQERIVPGEAEPPQPPDPEAPEGYRFVGWKRIVDPATGDVTYEAQWAEIGDVTVKYVDEDGTIYESKNIKKGDPEGAEPADPTKKGFIFGGWKRTETIDPETGDLIVTYEAQWIPIEPMVSYVDPFAADGQMILVAGKYPNQAAADAEAASLANRPGDPAYDGYVFAGWAVNRDEEGNYIMVAKYNEVPDKRKPVIYVDGQSDELIVWSGLADDPSAVKDPSDPKHNGMVFIGWEEIEDAYGNVLRIAKYACDCANTPADDPKDDKKDPLTPSNTSGKSKADSAKTGDNLRPVRYIFSLGLAAVLLLLVFAYRRRKRL